MKLKRLSSFFQTLGGAFRTCLTRFPVAVAFVLALTAFLVFLVATEGSKVEDRLLIVLGYYLSVGFVLSLSLHLWGEEVKRRATVFIVHGAAQLLLAADALFLYQHIADSGVIGIGIAHFAGVLAVGLSVFFLSFFRERNDIPAWYFSLNTVGTLIMTYIIGNVLQLGIDLLVLSLNQLFGVNVDTKCYFYIAILCCLTLPLLMFLGLLPRGREKHNARIRISSFLNGIIRYLFLPLAGCYLFVLYVYAIRILFRWELPDGWVSWLVVTLMAISIGIVFGLYPTRIKEEEENEAYSHDDETLLQDCHSEARDEKTRQAQSKRKNRMAIQIMHGLPMLVLPLLLLMTVGIVRRFLDYGITINRLYLATLNLWFYAVCIGLIVGKARRISWIPISFSIVFLLTSVLPVNYASITQSILHEKVKQALTEGSQYDLPLSEQQYESWVKSVSKEEAKLVTGRLQYLQDWYGAESITDLVAEDIVFDHIITEETDRIAMPDISYQQSVNATVEIPQGYKYCTMIKTNGTLYNQSADHDRQCVVSLEAMGDTVCIPLDSIRTYETAEKPSAPMLRTTKGNWLMLTSFTYYLSSDTSNTNNLPKTDSYYFALEGYLYHNKKQ